MKAHIAEGRIGSGDQSTARGTCKRIKIGVHSSHSTIAVKGNLKMKKKIKTKLKKFWRCSRLSSVILNIEETYTADV